MSTVREEIENGYLEDAVKAANKEGRTLRPAELITLITVWYKEGRIERLIRNMEELEVNIPENFFDETLLVNPCDENIQRILRILMAYLMLEGELENDIFEEVFSKKITIEELYEGVKSLEELEAGF